MATIELLRSPELLHDDIFFLGPHTWVALSADPAKPTRLSIEPGTHQLLTGSANVCPFTVTVAASGTVQYDSRFEGLLTGNGSARLTFVGLPVTIDARYVSGQGVLIFEGEKPEAFIRYRQCRMLPTNAGYQVEQGSSLPSSYAVFLDLDGRWIYRSGGNDAPQFDIAKGGFLGGAGTSTIEFLGYPCVVDSRATGGRVATIGQIGSTTNAETLVQLLDLLPIQTNTSFQVLIDSHNQGSFGLDERGTFTARDGAVAIDAFHQVPRIHFRRRS